jgi:hypothetical protein
VRREWERNAEERRPKPAARILVDSERTGYREPVVYLTLADLYRYRLGETAEAIARLEQHLESHANLDVVERPDELRAKTKRVRGPPCARGG